MFQFVIRHSSFIFVFTLSLSLLSSWGCHKKSSATAPPHPQTKTPARTESTPSAITPPVTIPSKPAPPEPVPPPKAAAIHDNFELGEADFKAGKYQQAALSFESFLSNDRESENRDRALFLLGLCRILPNDSSRDVRKGEAAFKELISEFPDSDYRAQAEFILGLQAQIERMRSDVRDRDERIKKLSEELQKLKEIDMQRRPYHPE
jgi:TolA-binding protein